MPHAEPHKAAHARHAPGGGINPARRRTRRITVVVAVLGVVGWVAIVGAWLETKTVPAAHHRGAPRTTLPPTTPPTVASTLPSVPPPCVPAPVPGGVYAVGDSVLVDAQSVLQGCVANIDVNASVSRQWSEGEAIMRAVMAGPAPPATVVLDLGTNGPVTDADFDTMMSIIHGASRVVVVTVHVDRAWQDPVNGVLGRGVSRYPTTVLADWEALAVLHPEWFYSDGTHLPIGGPGAQALADLIVAKL